jgi:DNA-binding CsgD family transcriptional regulator
LRALILDAARGGPGGGLRLNAFDDTDLLILVAPLPQRLSKNGGTKGLALVAIRAADDRFRLTAATVGSMFGLTPAEADLAFALFSGLSLADFMAERRVTESTARTQLTRVLQKTNCRNQRELVSLIGRLPQLR